MLKVLLVALLVTSAFAFKDYPHPELDHREVSFDTSISGLLEMAKRGILKGLVNPKYGGSDMLHVGSCAPESDPDAWKFLGNTEASLSTENPTAEWENYCFSENKASFRWVDAMNAEVVIETKGRKSLLCTDSYLITSLLHHDFKIMKTGGKHTIKYKFTDAEEVEVAKKIGLKVIKFCDHWYNVLPDLLMTLQFFFPDIITMKLGIKLPRAWYEKMYDNHYRFLHRWSGLKLVPRKEKAKIDPSFFERNAKSGDIMCRYAGGGTSSIILWATGAQCSHIAVYMWGEEGTEDEGKLFVLQSNENGIWKQPIADFWNENIFTSTVLLPLAPEYRAKFDQKKAWAWFKTVNGSPYGIHNMFFSFLDTPEDNWPQAITTDSWVAFLNMISQLKLPGENLADQIMGQAFNHRLGTQNLSFSEIIVETTKRGMTMGELISIPEKEGWLYNGKQQYVCSCFGIAVLYHGGLFGDMEIYPQEFTPADLFQLAIYDKNYQLPSECKTNDPELPYCMTSGLYKIDPQTYNRITPYSHMNERCPSKAPFYMRPDKC